MKTMGVALHERSDKEHSKVLCFLLTELKGPVAAESSSIATLEFGTLTVSRSQQGLCRLTFLPRPRKATKFH